MRMHRLEGTLPNGNRDDRPQQRRPRRRAAALLSAHFGSFPAPTPREPDVILPIRYTGLRKSTDAEIGPSCVGSRPGRGFPTVFALFVTLPLPETGSSLLTSQFRRAEILGISDCRPVTSEVAGSSPVVPAIPFNIFPAFSDICRDLPRSGSRRYPTSTDTTCPHYSG